ASNGTSTSGVRNGSISTEMAWVNISEPSDCSFPDNYDPTPGTPSPTSARKFNQIMDPAPAKASVFLDEREDSIDNGAIGIYPIKNGVVYWYVPGTRHSWGCNLSFGDGYAEHYCWLDKLILMDGIKFSVSSRNDRDAS